MTSDHRADSPVFAELLRRHRHAAGLTQEELAELAGISARGVSDLERGVRSHPHRETVLLLANALGLHDVERSGFIRAAPRVRGRAAPRHGQAAPRLPVPLSPLFGRRQEREAVGELLRDSAVRLVTLTGPGGVGKTRLALAAAEQAVDAFPDGLFFVDLAPLRDPALVMPQVATKLGVRDTAGRDLVDLIAGFLSDRAVLLVLDNFEHVLSAAAGVPALLAGGRGAKVLVTSRAPLRVRGEREFSVPPLRLPTDHGPRDLDGLAANEAVAFFIDRARAVRPDFALTADNAEAVTAVCRSLDGLPLALELAAARVKILPPQALQARLGARLPLLTGGARDAPERQRTMRDAIAWSYELLEPETRVLFHRLSVFAGGWTLEAAEAVANHEGDIELLEGLIALADLSLIQVDESGPEPRYRMLETIRELAQERLAASGQEGAVRRAHAAYFVELAERGKPNLTCAGLRPWLWRLETEHPNLRAALDLLWANDDHEAHLRLAASLGIFWWMRAHLAEGRQRLERAVTWSVAPTPDRAEALLGIGRIVTSQGDLPAGEMWLRRSEALARSLNAPTLVAQALFERGQAVEYAGDNERAVPLYEAALAAARELPEVQTASVVLWALGEAAYARRDLATAERHNEEAITLLRSAGDEFMLGLCLITRGAVSLARGDATRTIVAYEQTLALALGIEVDWVISGALAGFAAVAASRGDHVAAAQLLGAAETARAASHQTRMANFYHHAQTLSAVRAALGEEVFAAAWDAGRALPVEGVAALPRALGLLDTHPQTS